MNYFRVEPLERNPHMIKSAYVLTRQQDAIWVVLGWYGCSCDVWEVTGKLLVPRPPVPHHSYMISPGNKELGIPAVEIHEIPFESLDDIVHVRKVATIEITEPGDDNVCDLVIKEEPTGGNQTERA